MTALLATIIAALVAGPLAIYIKSRIDRRQSERGEAATAKASLERVTETRVERLFSEYDRLRSAYREDLGDLRRQLQESNTRLQLLEHEVAEWRSGLHGVVGVWVAVPAHIWEMVREALPDLPPTRFPGERDSVEPPPTT